MMRVDAHRWELLEVAAATGGTLVGSAGPVDRVVIDSREAGPGALFVALPGTRTDGHAYAAAAAAAGAVPMVGAGRGVEVSPRIEVPDPLTALRDLAAWRRSTISVPVVAVTGSTGKTSTKELLDAVLADGWASPRSYNNEIGVPLTVLSMPPSASALVLEVGSRGRGHIEWLMPAVRPSVAIITNLGLVHLETFGSEASLADAKWELAEGVDASGTIVVPAGEPRLRRPHPGRVLTFGPDRGADVRISEVTVDDELRPSFRLHAEDSSAMVRLSMRGAHQAFNAAAATAAGLALGLDLETIAARLPDAVGADWRMEITRGRYMVLNDAYNANPTSMEAALRSLALLPAPRIAVLGEMAELGPVTEREHRRIGALATELGIEHVITVGPVHGLDEAAGAVSVPDDTTAYGAVRERLAPGGSVLVKASRSVGLEALAQRLAEEARS